MSFEEQIMSKDKYASTFSCQMEAIVFIILQIFFATCRVLKIGEYPWIFPSFSWGIFGQVTLLDQSCEGKYLMDYKYKYVLLNCQSNVTKVLEVIWASILSIMTILHPELSMLHCKPLTSL